MQHSILGALLDVPPPAVDATLAGQMADELFGVRGTVTGLGGERDGNFRICEPDGNSWVLKIVHPHELPEVSDLQDLVLEHLATHAPALPVPRLRRPLGPDQERARWVDPSLSSSPLRVRMYSYLPGVPLSHGHLGAEVARHIGAFVAELDRALVNLAHPGQTQDLAWDAHRVERIEPLVNSLPRDEQDHVTWVLDHFRTHAAPALAGLRRQLIHNDANLDNVLTPAAGDPQISGLIDFGDMLTAPLVQDVATAAAYQLRPDGHPMAGSADVVVAYHQRLPLMTEEVEVLADLIAARWVLTTTITGWRAARQPGNRDYILRNSEAARAGLRRLRTLGFAGATDYLREAIER